jgi:tetratricopeptide (TPR) repeat protein
MIWDAIVTFLMSGWDAAKVITAIAGLITIFGGGWGLYWRISTAETRRLQMLHDYIETREGAISTKRAEVLDGIKLSEHFQLEQKALDVGAEIDDVIELLDQDRLKQAMEALVDLEERLERKKKIVRKYADELVTHKASVHVFIAALADRRKRTELGLEHVASALAIDNKDKDALKYQGWLLLRQKDLPGAEESFGKLRQISVGSENDRHRCDAWEGLGFTYLASGPDKYAEAEKAFANALNTIRKLTGNDKDAFARGRIHDALGDIYASELWDSHDTTRASENYQRAIAALSAEGRGKKEQAARSRAVRGIQVKLEKLQKEVQAEFLQ